MVSADLVLFEEVCATNLPRCYVGYVGRLDRIGGSDFERIHMWVTPKLGLAGSKKEKKHERKMVTQRPRDLKSTGSEGLLQHMSLGTCGVSLYETCFPSHIGEM